MSNYSYTKYEDPEEEAEYREYAKSLSKKEIENILYPNKKVNRVILTRNILLIFLKVPVTALLFIPFFIFLILETIGTLGSNAIGAITKRYTDYISHTVCTYSNKKYIKAMGCTTEEEVWTTIKANIKAQYQKNHDQNET